MRDEILSGLRTAIEHGSSLDKAIQSFINAGYNPAEVRQAASSLREGATSIITQQKQKQTHSIRPSPVRQFPVSKEANHNQIKNMPSKILPKKKNKNLVLIILITIFLLLIGALALFIFFKPFA